MESLSHHIWIGFVGGLLGFAHCLGMCGGFVLQLSQGPAGKRTSLAPLIWFAGKLFSYLLLGAVAGFAGGFLVRLLSHLALFQNLLSYLAGGMILIAGLSLLGLLPVGLPKAGATAENVMAAAARKLFVAPAPGAALALGLGTGFLPCPIVLAFLAYALQSGSVVSGMGTMGALGLGTGVPLLLLGGLSRFSGLYRRRWAPKAGGILLVLLGVTTVLRGTTLFHLLIGCPETPVLQQEAVTTERSCCPRAPLGNGSGN